MNGKEVEATHVKDPYPNPEPVYLAKKKFEVKSGF